MLMIQGDIHHKTSNVLAMSAIMTLLVGMKLVDRFRAVDMVSATLSHSRPKALGCGEEYPSVMF